MPQRLLSIVLGTILTLAGCDLDRGRLMKEKYPTYPDDIKRAIDRGYVRVGMDHDQVHLSLGEPMCKKTILREERPVEVWLYPPGGRDPCTTALHRVYFENGMVTDWANFDVPARHTDPPGGVP